MPLRQDSLAAHEFAPAQPRPGLRSLTRNLVRRRSAEEALLQSEERYRIVTETAIDAIVTIDERDEILFVNRSAERIFGYSTEEMLGRNLALLLPAYRSEKDRGAAARELAGRHKDGSGIALEVSFGEFVQGSQTLATGVLRDISRRKRAEEELRRANETLRALIEATPLAIVAVDAEEKISEWNTAAQNMFGWSEAEVLGKPFPAVYGHGERMPAIEAARRGVPVTAECGRQTKDGAAIETSVSAAPLTGPDGAVAGAVAVITDITDRKRMEGQLRQAQKMEAVGRLAGGIAHDFNNLLTVITGYGDLLLSSLPSGERALGYAQEILQSAEKAAALTKQLLAFSRHQVAHPALFDINPVVTSMSNMLRRLIGEDIELAITLHPGAVMVQADPTQIEQIVVNLIVNARDAMPNGGRITMETGVSQVSQRLAQTNLKMEPGRWYVSLTVTDTGGGMTETTQSHMFEPFFTTKEAGKGTGLGLATIYGIVKANNGDIWVSSEVGKGSTFTVYLPAAAEGPAQAADDAGARLAPPGKETILLVEDESGLREMIRELLESLGYTVLAAANSHEAIRMSSIHPGYLHLLLTDVVLPKASGRELSEWLRRLRRHTRVLYMSGYPTETVVQHGVLKPNVAFLEKPFTPESLAQKVREVLDAPASAVA
jgi:two-component system, cell cycle sensor histidine kinase and response regulator CckA